MFFWQCLLTVGGFLLAVFADSQRVLSGSVRLQSEGFLGRSAQWCES